MTPFLSNMSTDDMRVAMAEVDGHKIVRKGDKIEPGINCIVECRECGCVFNAMFINPESEELWAQRDHYLESFSEGILVDKEVRSIPDYLNSLDAVAPVEARLTDAEWRSFRENIEELTYPFTIPARFTGPRDLLPRWGGTEHQRAYLSATALQRTKAILLATGKATL